MPQGTATAKDDSAAVKKDNASGLYVIVAQPREGNQIVELHTAETAEARVTTLTWGSKQHLAQAERDDVFIPEENVGGSYQVNRDDVHVYKLSATEVSSF